MTPTSPPGPRPPSPGRTPAGNHPRGPGAGLKQQAHMETLLLAGGCMPVLESLTNMWDILRHTCKDIFLL